MPFSMMYMMLMNRFIVTMKNNGFLTRMLACSVGFILFFTACSSQTDDDDEPVESPVMQADSLELHCVRDGRDIYGWMYRPEGITAKLPLVVLSHSYSLTADAMRGYARWLAEEGYAAYCFDFCGGSEQSRSDGDFSQMTPFTEVADLQAVLSTLRQRSDVDASRLFLLGSSLGGVVSALVAEERAADVAGLILFYPAFNIAELVNKYASSSGLSGMSEAFVASLSDYQLFQHIGTYEGDVLILHGSADFIVPLSYSRQAAGLYPHAELQEIEGATHGFNAANLGALGSLMGSMAKYDAVVMPLVLDYLSQHTGR